MIKYINFAFVAVVVTLLSCDYKKSRQDTSVEVVELDKPTQTEVLPQPKRDYKKTHYTHNYSFTIISANGEVSNLKIYSDGIENEYSEKFEVEGQVIDSYMADINQDGFEEFYLRISPTDDSGNINLMGFASNRGKSISQITIQEPTDLREVNSDKLTIKRDKIVREFKTNGKQLVFNYELVPGEASYTLNPIKQ